MVKHSINGQDLLVGIWKNAINVVIAEAAKTPSPQRFDQIKRILDDTEFLANLSKSIDSTIQVLTRMCGTDLCPDPGLTFWYYRK